MYSGRISNRRQLLEAYLILHDFRMVRSQEDTSLFFQMIASERDYALRVDHEWLKATTHHTVQVRLDTLGLVPFLHQNGTAWIRVTPKGQETITCLTDWPSS